MSFPRDSAIRILTRVLSDRQPLDEALGELASGPHRSWLQELSSGVLRWKGRLDWAIDSAALKKKPTGWLRKLLLTGAYQLIAQDRVSASQVVSECVDEAKKKEGEAPAKFVNAILRKISASASQWRELAWPASEAEQAAWANLPPWLWSRIRGDLGETEARDFARASLERPRLWLRGAPGWEPPTELGAKPGPVAGSFWVEKGPPGAISSWPGFQDGKFIVQDISSQVLVEEISDRVRSGCAGSLRALDLCAAPGGKSVGMAWKGFQVTATDRSADRLRLLEETVARTRSGVEVVKEFSGKSFDWVWVDAPCSGSGIIRRHPDVRWLRQEKELVSLSAAQDEVVRRGWEAVKPGGFLAYSVCSILKSERPPFLSTSCGEILGEWHLGPAQEPFGDGFWAVLVQKSPI